MKVQELSVEELDRIKAHLPEMPMWRIVKLIRSNWRPVYFGAEPYLGAMSGIEKLSDPYGFGEDGRTQVLYFLSNATTWRGGVARLVKAELNRRLKTEK
jgi:hypothetical protein